MASTSKRRRSSGRKNESNELGSPGPEEPPTTTTTTTTTTHAASEAAVPGVKLLSGLVLEYLQKHPVTTYKEVSEHFKQKARVTMKKQQEPKGNGSSKKIDKDGLDEDTKVRTDAEWGSMKRRIYDILNVLMAMHILKKEDNQLIFLGRPNPGTNNNHASAGASSAVETDSVHKDEESDDGSESSSDRRNKGHLASMEALSEEVQTKRKKLSNLMHHHLLVDALIQRNKARVEQHTDQEGRLSLPFIIVSAKQGTPCEVQHEGKTIVLSYEGHFELMDDVEALIQMGLENDITIDQVERLVPPELVPFLPDSILDRLRSSERSKENGSHTVVGAVPDGTTSSATNQ